MRVSEQILKRSTNFAFLVVTVEDDGFHLKNLTFLFLIILMNVFDSVYNKILIMTSKFKFSLILQTVIVQSF